MLSIMFILVDDGLLVIGCYLVKRLVAQRQAEKHFYVFLCSLLFSFCLLCPHYCKSRVECVKVITDD